MKYHVTLMPSGKKLEAEAGENLLSVLRREGIYVPAYCGGKGTCGKCLVRVDGVWQKACSLIVDKDLTVEIKEEQKAKVLTKFTVGTEQEEVLTERETGPDKEIDRFDLAVDIGTTTIASFLLDDKGGILAMAGRLNPQCEYGADVVSRLQYAREHGTESQVRAVRKAVCELVKELVEQSGMTADHAALRKVRNFCTVGNPAMQQLFLDLPIDNLLQIPYHPVILTGKQEPLTGILPDLDREADDIIHITVPDVSAYVGADTVAAALAEGLDQRTEPTLLVDIGTNGEMMLSDGKKLYACATAAGPAFEGASIRFGMHAAEGAIDHVSLVDGRIVCHVIGEGQAIGICGSGLIDAISCFLEKGDLDRRGKIKLTGGTLPLTGDVYLTQEDVRALQTAKGAVAAGIELMIREAAMEEDQISKVLLAGAFGSYIQPESACRIGLLPEKLLEKVKSVGNAAGKGACLIASDPDQMERAEKIAKDTTLTELSTHPQFDRCFAKNMYFTVKDR